MALEDSKFFKKADRLMGNVLSGADFIMVIEGYEHLAFNVKTNSLPTIKNDKIEYTTTHGIKTYSEGKIQTLNDLPVTFMERDSLIVKETIETIIASGENEELSISFFSGKSLKSARLWGRMTGAGIFLEDNPEADAEATTSAMSVSATLTGHYAPEPITGTVSLIDTILNAFK